MGCWDLQSLAPYLPASSLNLVMYARLADQREDPPVWGNAANGGFSTKAAYALLESRRDVEHAAWRRIWKTRAPMRSSLILWQARLDRLKTNALLYRRTIRTDPSCDICHGVYEDSFHVLGLLVPARKLVHVQFLPEGRLHIHLVKSK